MTSCVTYTWSRSFLTKDPVVRPSSIPTPSAVGRMPGRGAASWSWRRAISGMGSSRKSGPLISGSKTKAPGSPRRLSVVTSDDEPAPRRIAYAVWTHLGTGLDKAVIVLTSDRAAPSRCAARTPWAVRLTSYPKVPSGISSRSACLTTSETSTSLGTMVNRSWIEPTGSGAVKPLSP